MQNILEQMIPAPFLKALGVKYQVKASELATDEAREAALSKTNDAAFTPGAQNIEVTAIVDGQPMRLFLSVLPKGATLGT